MQEVFSKNIATISDTLLLQDSALFSQWLNDARDAKDMIDGPEDWIVNERTINELYLKYLEGGLDTLDSDDSTFIAAIALSCPYVSGPSATYKARTLYSLYVPAVAYDDIYICNSQGVYKGVSSGIYDEEIAFLSAQKPQAEAPGLGRVTADGYFKVFPNPTSREITIEYSKAGTLVINDALGGTVYSTNLPKGKRKITIDLLRLTPGVYTYKHMAEGVQLEVGKLVITR